MPTYSYHCKSCGYSFDLFQKMSDQHATTCPQCHTDSLKRLIGSGGGIIFKVSGFYATDYRSSEYQEKAKADCEPCSHCTCGKDSKAKSAAKL